MKRWIIFQALMMAACVPVENTVVEPVKEPAIVEPKVVKPPIETKASEEKEAVKEPVKDDWDCSYTNNEVINAWKLKYKCDKLT